MGIWSWLFPSDEDLLRRAKARMAGGRWADARKDLMHCKLPEAEALYDQCSAEIDKGERATRKKQLVAEGFHGWKVEVTARSARLREELTRLVTEELERAGVDLALPEVEEKAFKAALARAQRRVKRGSADAGVVRLVPVMEERLAKAVEAQAQAAGRDRPR